uniref:ARAD1C32978p n=1 Tax=Blastobotrys adeninivorans TaxID=409370 RepID=A0A060T8W7_BLAAD
MRLLPAPILSLSTTNMSDHSTQQEEGRGPEAPIESRAELSNSDESTSSVTESTDQDQSTQPKQQQKDSGADHKQGEQTTPSPESKSESQEEIALDSENEEARPLEPPPVPPKDEEQPPPVPPKDHLQGQKFVLSETGTEVYVTKSESKAKKLAILLTNSLGLASVNNLRLADQYAEVLKFPVVVPDLFDKDPIPIDREQAVNQVSEPADSSSLLASFKVKAANTVKGFLDEMWLAKHTYERTAPQLSATIAEIVEVFKPEMVAVIGYSFGGRYVLNLLEGHESNAWSADEDLVAVGATIHPSLVKASDFAKVTKPLLMVSAANDPLLPDNVIRQGVGQLQENNVEFDTITKANEEGEDLPHGFAVPGDYPESVVGEKPREVVEAVARWIMEHLY